MELEQLSRTLGHPGTAPLWLAVKKRGLAITRKQVESYVKKKGEKQVFQAAQPAKGKTVSESLDARWMMDLIQFNNKPVEVGRKTLRFILVAVNVFDRYLYALPLESKEPKEVLEALTKLITVAPRKPKLISSDDGLEFKGVVSAYLTRRGIVQKFKDTADVNGLGMIDKAIQSLKVRLAEATTVPGKTWASELARIVNGFNNTPKSGVLHGATPKEVRGDEDIRFMLLQDQAKKMGHNTALTVRRTSALQDAGAFRAPVPVAGNTFTKSYQAKYGAKKEAASVSAGTVTDSQGVKHALKSIQVIPVNSSEPAPSGLAAAKPLKKRVAGGNLAEMLLVIMRREGGPMSLTRAATLLKEQLRQTSEDYDELLKKSGGKLADVIRLSPGLKLVGKTPGSKQSWYYVDLV
jgi:hypothetical protein